MCVSGILPTYPEMFQQFASVLAETITSQEESVVLQLDTTDI